MLVKIISSSEYMKYHVYISILLGVHGVGASFIQHIVILSKYGPINGPQSCGISPDFSQLGLTASSPKYQAIFHAISQDNC